MKCVGIDQRAGGVFVYMALFELAPPHVHGRLPNLRLLLVFTTGFVTAYLTEAIESWATHALLHMGMTQLARLGLLSFGDVRGIVLTHEGDFEQSPFPGSRIRSAPQPPSTCLPLGQSPPPLPIQLIRQQELAQASKLPGRASQTFFLKYYQTSSSTLKIT